MEQAGRGGAEMNKNNFFVKFARFYLANLKGLKDKPSEIWDAVVDDFIPALVEIISGLLFLILHVILCFLPVSTIIGIFTAQYLTPDEVKRLKGDDGYVYKGGYFFKKEIKELENELLREQKKGVKQ